MGAMSSESRSKRIIRRWLSVAMVAATTFALTLVVWWLQRERLNATEAPPTWTVVVVLAAGLSAAVLWLGPRRFIASIGLRHGILFPPYWIGLALGIASSLAFATYYEEVRATLELDASNLPMLSQLEFLLGIVPAAVIVLSIAGHAFTSRQRQGIAPEPLRLADEDEWLLSDAPVTHPDDDRFDFQEAARRIAQRLVEEPQPAQAVLGRLGSGKTTLRNLTQAHAALRAGTRPIEFVNVELWPYETPSAAVEGVLRLLVEALAREISTSRLNGLPAAYAETITKASGLHSFLPQPPSRSRTPSDVLREIDDMATVIGRRYVLWVEDLERFALSDPAAEQVEASELERLAPIRALLFGLDNSRSITVVTATTTLFQRFDLEKIARYVERIPELRIRTAQRTIAKYRKRWLAKAGLIDPGSSHRASLGWDTADAEYGGFAWLAESVHDLASATAALAATPRILKQGLRRAYETWRAIPGEIDLDDTIAMSIVREASPRAFALIESHADRLRGQVVAAKRDSQPLNDFSSDLSALKLEPRVEEAVMFVVRTVFDKHNGRPQGFRNCDHADYWHRFLVLPEIAAKDRDQRVLRLLIGESDDDILRLLSDPEFFGAVEDFAVILSAERLQGLFLKYVHAHLDDDPSKWPPTGTGTPAPPGLIPLWRMIRDRMGDLDLDRLAADVERALELAAPKNLALTEEIAHWMLSSSPQLADLFPRQTLERLQARVRELLWTTYDGHPKELVASLRNAFPFTLVWLCWGLERIRAGQAQGIPFDEWPRFSKTVIAAMDMAPDVMVPQVAAMVARQTRSHEGPQEWRLERERCAELFEAPDDLMKRVRGLSFDKAGQPWVDALRNGVATDSRSRDAEGRGADAVTEIVRASGKPGVATRPAMVEGFWFDYRDDIKGERPSYSPTGAVFPEGGKALDKEAICLDMVAVGDEWLPLSESGLYTYSHSTALANKREYYFVPSATWPRTYIAELHGTAEPSEVAKRFDPELAALARPNKQTLLLKLTEV